MKRMFDVIVSAAGLTVLLPLMAAIAAAIAATSEGPVLFRQERIGRRFRPFVIYKFRTMRTAAGRAISVGEDPRITSVGRLLRKTKLDELPQLFNVLKGDMSLVGPRPELAQYVDLYRDDYREILEARPGITDLASIKYSDEASVLAAAADPESEYVTTILPDKIRLGREYVRRSSVAFDLALIARTLCHVAGGKTTV